MEILNHWKSCINCGFKIVISTAKNTQGQSEILPFFISSEIASFYSTKKKGSFEHWTILNLLLTPIVPHSILRSAPPVLPWLRCLCIGSPGPLGELQPISPSLGLSFSFPVSLSPWPPLTTHPYLFKGQLSQKHMIELTTASLHWWLLLWENRDQHISQTLSSKASGKRNWHWEGKVWSQYPWHQKWGERGGRREMPEDHFI